MIEIPRRLRQRPRDPRGYPIPYSVLVLPDGTPDFRVTDVQRWLNCVNDARCALCGQNLTGNGGWFVGGPLCSHNRFFTDPAMHRDCAEYALRVCPFLAIPKAHMSNPETRPPVPGAILDDAVAVEKPDRFMLGHAPSWSVVKGGGLIHAAPWRELLWWKDGAPL